MSNIQFPSGRIDDAMTFHWPGEPRNVPNHFPEFIVNSLTIQCLAQEVCIQAGRSQHVPAKATVVFTSTDGKHQTTCEVEVTP
jgi:hypothetical protein